MLNIPKENVKTFLLVVGGVAALVIISMIIDINLLHRNVFYKEDVDLTQYSNTAESKVQENKYELVSEGRRILFYTDEIMDMINNKEFDKLYNILDEKYRSLYVKSVKDLEEDMERFADGQYNLGYDEYYKEGNMFLIDARFEKINKTQEEIINSKATPIDTLCIREIEKGKYTVAFRGFIDKKEVNKETSNDLAKIKIKEMTVRSEEIELNIEVENLTNEKLNLYNSKLDIVTLEYTKGEKKNVEVKTYLKDSAYINNKKITIFNSEYNGLADSYLDSPNSTIETTNVLINSSSKSIFIVVLELKKVTSTVSSSFNFHLQ